MEFRRNAQPSRRARTNYFEVKLDDEPGGHYAMRYDSVLLYAEDDQPGFARFRLPSCFPANPDDEILAGNVAVLDVVRSWF